MGKTAAGAVWLNADMLALYDYWQFWRNTEDGDVERFLKLFTMLPLDEIARSPRCKGQEINEAKKVLATEATALLHGRAAADQAADTARTTFEEGALAAEPADRRDAARRTWKQGSACSARSSTSRPGGVERRGAPSDQRRRSEGERRRRHRREDVLTPRT